MGRVFTWEEIVSRAVPRPPEEKYPAALAYLRAQLERSSAVCGALLFGSLVRDDWTARSDVDCLVILEDSIPREESAAGLAALTLHAARRWHVEISFEVIGSSSARVGRHTVGPLFFSYLRGVDAGNVIKQNPLSFLAPNCFSPATEFRDYLMVQEERLRSGLELHRTFTPEKFHRFLRKVAESGIHTARKQLQYCGYAAALSRQTVIDFYTSVFDPEGVDLLQRLVAVDYAYTQEVLWQLQHRPDRGRYQRALEQLLAATPLALEFVAFNWNQME